MPPSRQPLMTAGLRVARNVVVMVASQPLTWALSLAFMVLVPRNVGPAEWGEWGIAWAIGLVVRAGLDLGVNTVVLKDVARRPEDAGQRLGTAIATRLLLAPILVLVMLGFAVIAGYSEHTRAIVLIISLTLALSYVGTPIVFALQAFEEMHVVTLAKLVTSGVMLLGAAAILKVFTLGVISVAWVALIANVAGLVIEWKWLARKVRIRPVFIAGEMIAITRAGIPYYAGAIFFTAYVWVDAVLLSLLGSRTEVGWYSVSAQLISTLGFLPYAVSTAVLPAMARSYSGDREQTEALAARSFQFLAALALPMTGGLIIVARPLVQSMYGDWFSPAAAALSILALTLLPVYLATLINGFLVAADRQVQWMAVMGAMCIVNPLLNLFLIPYFHAHGGNGAVGAAYALLVTDSLTGIIALILLPPKLRRTIARVVPSIARAAIGTAVMLIVIWPLRHTFVLIPIVCGALAFGVAAIVLRVFPPEAVSGAVTLWHRVVLRLTAAAASLSAFQPLREADPASNPAMSVVICTCDRPDSIGAAVESVLAQEFDDFEVIVVDQSRDGGTEAVVNALGERHPNLRYVRLAERGLSRAYNRGVSEARHELLAFTDDDCVAPTDWLATIAAALNANLDVDLVYGQVLEPVEVEQADGSSNVIPTLPITRAERISMRHGFRVFGMGANFAARRSALLRLGGFDEVLGGGGPLQSAQDFDFAYRLCRAGGTILLEPAVVVRHYGSRTPEQWPATIRSYGIGVGGFYFKHVRAGDLFAGWLLTRELILGCLRLGKRAVLRQPTGLYRTFLSNVAYGMRRSLAFPIDRRLRLYQPERAL